MDKEEKMVTVPGGQPGHRGACSSPREPTEHLLSSRTPCTRLLPEGGGWLASGHRLRCQLPVFTAPHCPIRMSWDFFLPPSRCWYSLLGFPFILFSKSHSFYLYLQDFVSGPLILSQVRCCSKYFYVLPSWWAEDKARLPSLDDHRKVWEWCYQAWQRATT